MMLLARNLRSRLRAPLAAGTVAAAPFFLAATAEAERVVRDGPRNDWTRAEIQAIYDSPLLDLLFHGVRTNALAPPKQQSFLLSSPVPEMAGLEAVGASAMGGADAARSQQIRFPWLQGSHAARG
jgi:hypothetical protein